MRNTYWKKYRPLIDHRVVLINGKNVVKSMWTTQETAEFRASEFRQLYAGSEIKVEIEKRC